MYKTLLTITIVFFLACFCHSQELLKEPSTGKSFPAEVKFNSGGKEYSLKATGIAVRKKLFFKVYGMIHYMENIEKFNNKNEAYETILKDGKSKQITMDFARDVDAQKIRDAYLDGFKNNATSLDLKAIQHLVDQFVGYFTTDVKENDQFIIRWLPGGVIVPIIKGEVKPAITNETFARILWTIWFGKDSIVDRDKLIEKILR